MFSTEILVSLQDALLQVHCKHHELWELTQSLDYTFACVGSISTKDKIKPSGTKPIYLNNTTSGIHCTIIMLCLFFFFLVFLYILFTLKGDEIFGDW